MSDDVDPVVNREPTAAKSRRPPRGDATDAAWENSNLKTCPLCPYTYIFKRQVITRTWVTHVDWDF